METCRHAECASCCGECEGERLAECLRSVKEQAEGGDRLAQLLLKQWEGMMATTPPIGIPAGTVVRWNRVADHMRKASKCRSELQGPK